MPLYRTVIVDEKKSREDLAMVLRQQAQLEIIHQCESGEEAIEVINTEHPDLVFLEIELPHINGFEVIERSGARTLPLFILISKSKSFAMRAFEVEALDYIQKPIVPKRIEKSLNRFYKRMNNGVQKPNKEMGDLIRDLQRPHSLERFIIKQSGEYHLIKTADIYWIEADGNYSRIITRDKKFMVRYTLSGFEDQLNPERFYRISRSQIVNLDYVAKIKDHIYGNFIVELTNGSCLKMSKNYKELFDALKNF